VFSEVAQRRLTADYDVAAISQTVAARALPKTRLFVSAVQREVL